VLAPALLLLVVTPSASAEPLDAARDMTVFVAGDATLASNENDGTIAVGGDLVLPSGGEYRLGQALYLRGKPRFNGGRLTVRGSRYTGGPTANGIDFNSAFAALRSDADTIASFPQDVSVSNWYGGAVNWNSSVVTPYLSLTSGTNVWRLTSDQLRRINAIVFRSMPADATLLVTVTDWISGTWKVPQFSGPAAADRILFTFAKASAVTLDANSATLAGTVLAPRAAVSLNTRNDIQGSVIAATFSHKGGGKVKHKGWRGSCKPRTPKPKPTPTPTPTPTKPKPTPTPTPTPTPSPTPSPTPDPTPSPTPDPTRARRRTRPRRPSRSRRPPARSWRPRRPSRTAPRA